VQEAAQQELESKESKDLLWARINEITTFGDNQLRPELARAQQKKWVRATFSDFNNYYGKVRDFRAKVERDITKVEAVPMQSAEFQEYSRNVVAMIKRLVLEMKMVEDQLGNEKNVNEIAAHLLASINTYDEFKDYWSNRVRKRFLD
jgi:head-tail adaptor